MFLWKQAPQRTKQIGEAIKILPVTTEPAEESIFYCLNVYSSAQTQHRHPSQFIFSLTFIKKGVSLLETTKQNVCTDINNISKFSRETIRKKNEGNVHHI